VYNEIYKLTNIGAGFLAIMARPSSGLWMKEDFTQYPREGVKRIVSLLESQEAIELGLEDEANVCTGLHLMFSNFPIQDRGVPSNAHEYYRLVRGVYADVKTGVNTVIHCRAGIGRSGLVAAGVLCCAGMSGVRAFELISDTRRVQVPDTDEQKKWLFDIEDDLSVFE